MGWSLFLLSVSPRRQCILFTAVQSRFAVQMRGILGPFALLLAAAVASEVCASVCYQGQHIDPDAPGQYSWVTNENSAVECTELRLGGLNTGRYAAVASGRDAVVLGGVSASTEPAVVCKEGKASNGKMLACLRLTSNSYEDRSFEAPVERLEFSLSPVADASLDLKNNDGLPLFTIELHPYTGQLTLRQRTGPRDVDSQQIASLHISFPSRFWMTYNNCEIKVGVYGSNDPKVSLQLGAASQPHQFNIIGFSATPSFWSLYMSC